MLTEIRGGDLKSSAAILFGKENDWIPAFAGMTVGRNRGMPYSFLPLDGGLEIDSVQEKPDLRYWSGA
ncbi:MAG TPA: hypothetical protein DIU00_14460 [Phycisphaerales bacterium]|nr:hypothetical protein [Phycisphaerales bacterium]